MWFELSGPSLAPVVAVPAFNTREHANRPAEWLFPPEGVKAFLFTCSGPDASDCACSGLASNNACAVQTAPAAGPAAGLARQSGS